MREKKRFWLAVVLLIFFILFTFSVLVIDVQNVGPQNSKVGFATINQAFFKQIGTSLFWYQLTEILGSFPLLLMVYFAFGGLGQLISRKSIFTIDAEILYLGFLYMAIAAFYVLFEKMVINFRPILVEGQLETSYPSSHTFLAVTVLLTSFYVFRKEGSSMKKMLSYFCLLVAGLIIVGRIFSGVHWLTDIVGGILLGFSLVQFYVAAVDKDIKKEP